MSFRPRVKKRESLGKRVGESEKNSAYVRGWRKRKEEEEEMSRTLHDEEPRSFIFQFRKKERGTGARWEREEATVRGDKSGGKIRDRPTAPETQAIKREGAEPEGKSHSANGGGEFRTKFRRTKEAVQNDQKLCPLPPSFMSSRSSETRF